MNPLGKRQPTQIRLAMRADALAIARVGDASWRAAYRGLMPDALIQLWTVERRTERRLKRAPQARSRTWVLEVQHAVVAYCSSGPARDANAPLQRGEIISCYVHPDHWRKGYGLELLSFALEDMRGLEFQEAILWCLSDNVGARRFYEDLGFHVELERVAKSLSGFDQDHTRYRVDLRSWSGSGRSRGRPAATTNESGPSPAAPTL